jgi:hypothetical protein
MDDCMRNFEDALLELYIQETTISVEPIDRSANDIISETNRFKKEQRKAKKHLIRILNSSQMLDSNGSHTFQDGLPCYYVDPVKQMQTLKENLEKSVPLPKEVEKCLGISLEPRSINIWEQRHVKWQAAALVIWFLHPQAKMNEVKYKLLYSLELFELLELSSLKSVDNSDSRFRDLEDKISIVSPRKGIKGRPPKNENILPQIVLIPSVFNKESKAINSQALFIAINTIRKTLQIEKKNNEVEDHPIMTFYKNIAGSLNTILV